METAISTIKLLPETKSQIEMFASQLENSLNSGDVSAIDLLRFQKAMDKVFEKVKSSLIENSINELKNYEKSPIIKGTEFSIVEKGVKYDYSDCNDVEYKYLETALENAKKALKQRENFLKSLKQPMNVVDEDSGDIYTIYPPKKSSTTTVEVSFK